MELRHLKYFIAVSEALSFNKAAARLQVAQPALSRQVAVLEEALGAKLNRRQPEESAAAGVGWICRFYFRSFRLFR